MNLSHILNKKHHLSNIHKKYLRNIKHIHITKKYIFNVVFYKNITDNDISFNLTRLSKQYIYSNTIRQKISVLQCHSSDFIKVIVILN